jgi:NTP pyrophosphatase (non-canonical NTP hydrolase)
MNDPLSFKTLRAANHARQLEWDEGNTLSLAYLGNAAAGELGEMCNIIKKLEREALGLKGSRATEQELADEIADVIIYLDLVARHRNIDLAAAVRAKFNATSEKYGFTLRL